MSIRLTLPPDLAARLEAEAERRGTSTEDCAADLLDRFLPPMARAASLSADFARWAEEDRMAADDESADDFFRLLDEDRPAERKLFPDALRGVTW